MMHLQKGGPIEKENRQKRKKASNLNILFMIKRAIIQQLYRIFKAVEIEFESPF